ncbi:hypothetical protein [Paenibacillus tyrfis]|uniref:hypothetical protein n=1 Tax=Paenibacillus tyrfis TaxID=1501230 RepID=UPI00209D1B80|nr:hypothetical protein [Paenibacillus tyrfis]MCP1312413.1 hypothetical protein [Paenibacillus tyrfis]
MHKEELTRMGTEKAWRLKCERHFKPRVYRAADMDLFTKTLDGSGPRSRINGL